MPHVLGTRALPWPTLLLLLGLQPWGTGAWCSEEDLDTHVQLVSDSRLTDAVRLAVHTFNQHSEDSYAYRLERILSSSRKQVQLPMIFSMNLQLRRTICRKSEGNIDHCPFQDSPGLSNTITCFFTISTQPLTMQFSPLKKTCSEGLP